MQRVHLKAVKLVRFLHGFATYFSVGLNISAGFYFRNCATINVLERRLRQAKFHLSGD